jgi:cysteine synthase
MLPAPRIEPCGPYYVVRDDQIAGGTKQRALVGLIEPGVEYVYATPAYGYAQIALAVAARSHGARATVFVAKRKQPHARTIEAKAAGATLIQVPYGYLSNVQAKARAYCAATGATLLPFGFDSPAFTARLAEAARALDYRPAEVWVVVGSGTLYRALRSVWPDARFNVVQVGKAFSDDQARVFVAPETFEQDARQRPPIPSCSNYDAKVWQFLRQYAVPGALWWNVAA